jgi:dimethylhistidine N-methyltransferase
MDMLPDTKHPGDGDEAHLQFFADYEPPKDDFLADVLEGLGRPQKSLSPKYFYDQKGSALFDEICRTPEYYITRTELELLDRVLPEVAGMVGPEAIVIEWGSGSSWKIRKVLDALERPAEYIAIDISGEHLKAAAAEIARQYPNVKVGAICADFLSPIKLPREARVSEGRELGFLPGSTIGNFEPPVAAEILRRAADLLGSGGALLIGTDLQKDEQTLLAAYNDAGGVTAAFNLNLLERMKTELGAQIDVDAFEHEAIYNTDFHRIEMHLRARRATTIKVAGHTFAFVPGETIHTENSHKFTVEGFQAIAKTAGFDAGAVWTDDASLFALHYLTLP